MRAARESGLTWPNERQIDLGYRHHRGVVAALCCFTPLLVVLLGAAGLPAVAGYLDSILLPAIVIFAGIAVYALLRRRPA